MRVSDIHVVSLGDACELRARIACDTELAPYDGRPIEPFDLRYRFPAWCAGALSPDNGDPFLAAMLVPAMTLGERLEIPAPVSPALQRALPEIQSILQCFDPRQARIDVIAPTRDRPLPANEVTGGVGLFFSLGVDSFYSLLKNQRDHPRDAETIGHLIAVHGMDVGHDPWDERVPPTMLGNWRRVAQETGTALLPVTTNLRVVLEPLALWTMAHGAGLASIALALGNALGTVRIAASTTYDQLYPWGSHPVLDPLWSTEGVRFIHDGCELDRIGKTALLAQSQLALDTLRVCPGFSAEYNCGRCVKCLPTMIDLLQLGALSRCRTLPHAIDAEQLRRILVAYRGGLNVEGYRRRHDTFADGDHDDLRVVLAQFLAEEDRAGSDPVPPSAASPPSHRRLAWWWKRQGR